jgi:hypothetical protein
MEKKMERDEVLSAFYHFTHGILIIIFIFIFCNIVLVFPSFFTIFWEKILFFILYAWNIYHSLFNLFTPFFLFLSSIFCNLFSFKKILFFTFFSLKNYYIKIKEIVFNCNNCNIVLFFITLKLV